MPGDPQDPADTRAHDRLPPALTEAEARAMAAAVRATRPAVARVHDAVAALRRADDFKTVALDRHDLTGAVAAALCAADRLGFLPDLLAALGEAGLIDLAAAAGPLRSPARGGAGGSRLLLPQDAQGRRIEVQGFEQGWPDWLSMDRLVRGLRAAVRRTCRVDVAAEGDDPPGSGTGFLIGPQTVLTNWHVVARLLDPGTGRPREGSHKRLSCRFDRLDAEGPDARHDAVEGMGAGRDWCVDFSPLAPRSPDPAAGLPDMAAHRPHALDFCAIRVKGAPGRMRGWYDLGSPGQLRADNRLLFVIQHPAGEAMRAAVSSSVEIDAKDAAFLLHRARTARGSSGGLCLDHDLRVIGLHHAEVADTLAGPQGKAVGMLRNRAVRVAEILKASPGIGAADPGQDRIAAVRVEGRLRPLIGRETSVAVLRALSDPAPPAPPAQPILLVNGFAGSGKTFTADLLDAIAPPGALLAIRLDADEIPPAARDLAALLLARLGATEDEIGALPMPAGAGGTGQNHLRDLVEAISRAVTAAAEAAGRRRTVWLVLDRLDAADIPATDARALLDALYAAAPGIGPLRVMLLGLGFLQGLEAARFRSEELPAPETVREQDLRDALAAILTDSGISPGAEDLGFMCRLVEAAADSLRKGGPPTQIGRISEAMAAIVLPAAMKWQAARQGDGP